MVGIIFFISLILFISAVLCQWLQSSREKASNAFLINWFPPFALFYAVKHIRVQKITSLSVLSTFGLSVVCSVVWGVALSSVENETDISYWEATLKGDELTLSDSNALFPQERLIISGKGLHHSISNLTAETNHQSKDYQVLKIVRDPATKSPNKFLMEQSLATFVLTADKLTVSLEHNGQITTYRAYLEQKRAQPTLPLTNRDVSRALAGFDTIKNKEVTYKVGTVQQISEKQSIVGLSVLKDRALLKEVTLTFDYRNGKYHLNNRSMLVLRKLFSEQRKSIQAMNAKKETIKRIVELESFLAFETQYLNKPVTLIKRDGSTLKGLFQNTEKQKVINITQTLGSGVVVVKTPLQLIEKLIFSNLTVLLPNTEKKVEVVYTDDSEQLESLSYVPVSVNQVIDDGREESLQGESIEGRDSVAEQEIKVAPQEQLKKTSPYSKLIGNQIVIYRIDSQKRSGRLKSVEPGKYIVLEQLQGGIEVRIPVADIESFELLE